MIAMLTIIRMKRHLQFDDKDDVAADDDIDNADDMMTMSLSLLRSSTRIGSTALWSRPPGSSPNTRSGLLPAHYQGLYSIDAVDRRLGSKWACQPANRNCWSLRPNPNYFLDSCHLFPLKLVLTLCQGQNKDEHKCRKRSRPHFLKFFKAVFLSQRRSVVSLSSIKWSMSLEERRQSV